MNENLLKQLKNIAVQSAINWAKTDKGYFTMRSDVNRYIEATGANKACGNDIEAIRLGRQAVAKSISIDAITFLDKSQLHKLDGELDEIVNDIPNQQLKGFNR